MPFLGGIVDKFDIIIDGNELPIEIHSEKRRGYRASFTKKGLTIRLPKSFTNQQRQETVNQLIIWAREAIKRQPRLLTNYQKKEFKSGDELQLFDKNYSFLFNRKAQKTITGKIKGSQILINLPQELKSESIGPDDLSKILAKHYKTFFQNRLNYWNACFPVKHETMRLKYNSSNWGSCSSKRNINLSTRLLLCPLPVIDYVIVHELTHLVHQNHSRQFWKELERVMPDYKIHHNWLKTRGSNLDFTPKVKPQPQP